MKKRERMNKKQIVRNVFKKNGFICICFNEEDSYAPRYIVCKVDFKKLLKNIKKPNSYYWRERYHLINRSISEIEIKQHNYTFVLDEYNERIINENQLYRMLREEDLNNNWKYIAYAKKTK